MAAESPTRLTATGDNITLEQMERAAMAADIDVEAAADNIHRLAREIRDDASA